MEAVGGSGILLPETGFAQPLRLCITTTKENVMKTKPCLCQDDVTKILDAAEKEARAHQWNVTIAVVDDGGHLMGLRRMDGCATISAYIAPEKARTAALGRRESKIYEDIINNGRISFLSAPHLQGMLEGGVPVMVEGACAGAVGVSGVKSTEDVVIAKAGIAALHVIC